MQAFKKWYVRLFFLGLVLAALWIVVHKATRPTPPAPNNWPSPQELDSMVRYTIRIPPEEPLPMRPTATVPVSVPGKDPFDQARVTNRGRRSSSGGIATPSTPRPRWLLSAILITDNRKAAVINEGLVSAGDQLPDGTRVISIERDQVVIEESNGTRHTLMMAGGGRT